MRRNGGLFSVALDSTLPRLLVRGFGLVGPGRYSNGLYRCRTEARTERRSIPILVRNHSKTCNFGR